MSTIVNLSGTIAEDEGTHDWLSINPSQIRFTKSEGGLLQAAWQGMRGTVTVRRLFPITRGDSYIAIADPEGNEWGILLSNVGLDELSRAALSSELRVSPYLPLIEGISSIRRRFNHYVWVVDTDYGQLHMITGPIYEITTNLLNGSRVITDLDDQKYLLPPDNELDKLSRKWIGKFL
ncbi:DUF1854 domain-containing protein [Cohnella luojiensis]|uniref:DUF1854 domain-containing protein n=1 Tax=Cohnella luojiensis TaxID=652876 RepID=A0A4Y8LZ78_9BACL|nr:DUF1854 domain-containing protein [Cohnella luojiensis]TFE27266.1 DUF1854 domain-containing protein [Cohnella luojiensis]